MVPGDLQNRIFLEIWPGPFSGALQGGACDPKVRKSVKHGPQNGAQNRQKTLTKSGPDHGYPPFWPFRVPGVILGRFFDDLG